MQFNRQKPLLNFIVDFYSARASLVIELDGSQHLDAEQLRDDVARDEALAAVGLRVLRFDNHQVLTELEAVFQVIDGLVEERLENPP